MTSDPPDNRNPIPLAHQSVGLTERGRQILARGGADGVDEEGMILLELAARAPGMSRADMQACFVALRMEYGQDALKALQSGAVQFEPRKPQ